MFYVHPVLTASNACRRFLIVLPLLVPPLPQLPAIELPLVSQGVPLEENLRQTEMDPMENPFWVGWTQRQGTTVDGAFVPDRREKNLLNFPPNRSALGDCEFKLTFRCEPGSFRGDADRGPWIRLMDRGQFGFVDSGTALIIHGQKMALPLEQERHTSPIRIDDGQVHSMSVQRNGDRLSFYVDGRLISNQLIDARSNLVFDTFPLESQTATVSLLLTAERLSDRLTTEFQSVAPIQRIYEGTGKPQEIVTASGAERIDERQDTSGHAAVYRIPAMVVTNQGTVLAFAEARASGYDWGHIRLVVRRSEDRGTSWGPEINITPEFSDNSCGNPSPVVERETGRVHLVYHFRTHPSHTHSGPTHVALTYSDDDGKTWSRSRFATQQFQPPHRRWLLTGPGHGIQLTQGQYRGRLVIPCYGEGSGYVVYSDDRGATWQVGGASPKMEINEAVCVELTGDRVMLNARSPGRQRNRGTCRLSHGGERLEEGSARFIPELPDPSCQGCTARYAWPRGDNPGIILYAGPGLPTGRVRATLWASYDEGQTWPFRQRLYDGPSGYSDLAVWPDGQIAYLFEKDGKQDLGFMVVPPPPAHPPSGASP